VNVAQACLGVVSRLISTSNFIVSKQLELKANVVQHLEYTVKYAKLYLPIDAIGSGSF
jgi:hypothetical protein